MPPPPRLEPTQEVRLAVVMYGGVSLAIYINGVAQELFRLCRATQRGDDDGTALPIERLRGTERVYRKLSHVLAQRLGVAPSTDENAPVTVRFIVDILSGSSAGGINAVYLAKALANGQTIDSLRRLWIDEGDIGRLLNDDVSVEGLGIAEADPPQSLLNGQRMYLKLLDALLDMDEKQPATPEGASPFVEKLDLYVTTTDVCGQLAPVRLADGLVHEKRHRR